MAVLFKFSTYKRNLLITLCSLILISSSSYAKVTCPNLDINASCLDGTWKVTIVPKDVRWELIGESVNGKPCANDEHSGELKWNYAFSSARIGITGGCNYSLFDNQSKQIGLIQIKSTYYHPTGSNWEQTDYPGNLICKTAQKSCLFR